MPPSDDPSTVRSLHRLVEHYTPDGALGRSLFALGGVTAATLSVFLAAVGLTTLTLGGLLVGLVGVVGLALSVPLTLAALWPVYLSLIGNVDSAAAYPDGAGRDAAPDPADSAEAVLKRRYAAGDIDHEEFEARLDRVVAYRDGRRGDAADGERDRRGDDDRSRAPERAR
ncbi:SHOCT domain-containing protein [Halobaculum lipolyticum]|uniref:SHOCT domain-containing protein n=1 Tax=Halobaculum lipolyticum TaxID=3032001 RepID=A0ABD5WC81_9EURY|nr:SHOCT domain-containing protein [Halobaculum sp. DT31]